MIEENKVRELVSSKLEGVDTFLVDVTIGSANDIRVLVDSMEGVSVEECAELSRWLTGEMDQDMENYSLEVSSPGLGAPLVLRQQYEKNIGREVEVVFTKGTKTKGILVSVEENNFVLEVTEKQISGGSQKKKKNIKVQKTLAFEDIKSTKVVIKF
jgi:ribosome maturation factor RimP